ncbi:MAG: hypothetical protein IT436_18195 [Phycisphaerales bacterium]|nr:hypothetical protein [Phycisphaerales bacterium]
MGPSKTVAASVSPSLPSRPGRHQRLGRVTIAGLVFGLPAGLAGVLLAATYAYALPPVPVPPGNPITEPKHVLGEILFWDEQLSSSNTMSCGSCHTPSRGGADPRQARHPGDDGIQPSPDDILASPGVIRADADMDYQRDPIFGLAPQITDRAANSNINAAYAPQLFWDGRAPGQFIDPQTGQIALQNGGALESQSVNPPVSTVEMAHPSYDWNVIGAKLARVNPLDLATAFPPDVADAIAANPTYPDLFRAAFGDAQITGRRIAFALATYQRTLISDQSPFDRFIAGETTALTAAQQRGLNAMRGPQARCSVCHVGDLFTGQGFRNIGLRPPQEDLGRQVVTGDPNDRGKFKVPNLRNVGLKRSFMHNGQFQTLTDVLRFYARAPGAAPQFPDNRDPVIPTIQLPPQVAADIQDFLTSGLTDPRVAAQTFPFDRPVLFAERPEHRSTIIGGGAAAGSGGIIPRIFVSDPGMVGNVNFRVGLDSALGGAQARLGISTSPPIAGRITPMRELGPVIADGAGAGNGVATLHWPLAPDEVAGGTTIYAQWFIADPSGPGGTAVSAVAQIPIFCGAAGCPTVCIVDFNGDGFVDFADYLEYLSLYDAHDPRADLNDDGFVDFADYLEFLNLYEAGC